ncbi:hypothetical protein ACOME3_010333 [Neoechinorhynchus agilis]
MDNGRPRTQTYTIDTLMSNEDRTLHSQQGPLLTSADFDRDLHFLSPSVSPIAGDEVAPLQQLASICSTARMSSPDDPNRQQLTSNERTNQTAQQRSGCDLLDAAKKGDLTRLIDIIESGADINVSVKGLNALHLATKEGHQTIVLELIKRGIRVDAVTKKRNTALHIACLAGQLEVARILINNGAYVNSQSVNGFTPLYMAAQENHVELVSMLLCLGADPNLATDDGFTPIAVALQQGHKRVVEMLFENDSKSRVRLPALHIAAKKNDVQSACLLLDAAASKASASLVSSPGVFNAGETDLQGQLVNCISKNGLTPLHIAAHYGHTEIAELLINRGADVNFVAQQSITALHVAAKWGRDNMVRLLLNCGAHIDARTQDGLTPLHCAAKAGHEHVVDTLLEHGAPITAKTKNGLTGLHMAAQGDHELVAKVLLSYKLSIIDYVTSDYLTALHVASHCGNANVARLLLERGSNIDAAALNGFTPLHIACKKGHFSLALLLLNAGANIHANTESGLTPLHVSSFVGAIQISQLLIESGARGEARTVRGETPLHLACRANQVESLRCLIQTANADVNAGAFVEATETTPRSGDRQTPLHVATSLGFTKCIQFLLANGAEINVMTKSGFTPLHLAAKQGNIEAAGILLEKGALPSINSCVKGQTGLSALHFASKYGHVKFVSLLLHRGAQPDIRGRNGLCPLHIATHYDHANVALVLLRSGASPHSQALNGYTALHIAARRGHLEITSILLEYNVHVNIASLAGFTPLHLACQFGHLDMVSLLLDHQANVNCKSMNGLTPLHLCAQENHSKCGELLVKRNANIDAQTKAGYTPLHVAAHFGHIHIVKFFVHLEAKVDCRTKYGYTPLHCAAQQNNLAIVRFLLEHGANPNIKSTFGQTASDIAERLGHVEIAEELKTVSRRSEYDTDEHEGVMMTENERSIRRKSLNHFKKSMPSITMAHTNRDSAPTDSDESTRMHLRRVESESAINRSEDRDTSDELRLDAIDSQFLFGTHLQSHDLFKHQQPEDIQEEQPLMDSSDEGEDGEPTTNARKCKKGTIKKQSKTDLNDIEGKSMSTAAIGHASSTLEDYLCSDLMLSSMGQTAANLNQLYLLSIDGFETISQFDHNKSTSAQHMLLDHRRRADDEDFVSDEISYKGNGEESDGGHHIEAGKIASSTAATAVAAATTTTTTAAAAAGGGITTIDHVLPDHWRHDLQATPLNSSRIVRTQRSFKTGNMHERYQSQEHSFLVSFIADAQGGKMIGCRQKNVMFIIPPKSASCPTRITCRFLRVPTLSAVESGDINQSDGNSGPNTRLSSFDRSICPPLNDGEGLACGIIELNPVGYKFLRPVSLDVPHSAALHAGQREIVIYRSDNGEKWEEHLCNHKLFMNPPSDDRASSDIRIARIITEDLPRYFALVSRLAFDSYNVDESGRTISSTFVPKAIAVIPEKALIKPVKVSLQAITVEPPASATTTKQSVGVVNSSSCGSEQQRLICNFLGKSSSLSPIVTIEPRRRKFHKPITIVIPLPSTLSSKDNPVGRNSADVRSLRLFCSITGGTHAAHWDDITGHTPLTLQNHDSTATFTSTVSARFWLIDAPDLIGSKQHSQEAFYGDKNGPGATKERAGESDEAMGSNAVTVNLVKQVQNLYRELMAVPYMVTIVVFVKSTMVPCVRRTENVQLPHTKQAVILGGRCMTIRLVCLTDTYDLENLLESKENFVEASRSKEIELLNRKPLIVEYCSDSDEQGTKKIARYQMPFVVFTHNRLEFNIPEGSSEKGVISLYQPRFPGDNQASAFCHLTVRPIVKGNGFVETNLQSKLDLSERSLKHISNLIGDDWFLIGEQLGITKTLIDSFRTLSPEADNVEMSAPCYQAFAMLTYWSSGPNADIRVLERVLSNTRHGMVINEDCGSLNVVRQEEVGCCEDGEDSSGFQQFINWGSTSKDMFTISTSQSETEREIVSAVGGLINATGRATTAIDIENAFDDSSALNNKGSS